MFFTLLSPPLPSFPLISLLPSLLLSLFPLLSPPPFSLFSLSPPLPSHLSLLSLLPSPFSYPPFLLPLSPLFSPPSQTEIFQHAVPDDIMTHYREYIFFPVDLGKIKEVRGQGVTEGGGRVM